ncbi:MAG: DEAD/DEAH box helicase [Nanobdellota archaeon]
MEVDSIKEKLHENLYDSIKKRNINKFLPSQEKAIKKGLLDNEQNMLICTPTASGKTLIAEMATTDPIFKKKGKAIYITPLKSLAAEKFKDFKERYSDIKISLSIGDIDSADNYLKDYELIITTSEKLDSEIRHDARWLKDVKTLVIDEIHLLNDTSRGPTLEILITLLKKHLKDLRIIGLSATIGNPDKIAEWLDAELIEDKWRPVVLKKGIYQDGKIEFKDSSFENKK